MLENRLTKIRQHLYANGPTSLQHLSELTGSSAATVRRDLIRLEEEGVVVRTYGGAALADEGVMETAFQARESQHLHAKRAIAEAAYKHLRPGSTIFLDAGTTVLQLARVLRLKPIPLTVITNGLAVAQEMLNLKETRVTLLGGQLRPENLSSVGPFAERILEECWFDQLFLGASAIHLERGIFTLDASEATLNRKMLEHATTRILMADATKFGQTAPYFVAPIQTVDHVISDTQLKDPSARKLTDLGVHLERVPLR